MDSNEPSHDSHDRETAREVPSIRLKSGSEMPRFGLGTWQLEGQTAFDVVSGALDTGIRHIDTAQMYGNETEVGRAMTQSDVDRDDVFITTKVGNDDHEPEALVASVEASLQRLQTDRVDLLLIHWPVEFDRIGASLSTMAQLQSDGLVGHLGVSNFTRAQLDQTVDMAPLEVLQCECHPFLQQVDLRSWCTEHDWAFTAYSPLARGEVFGNDVLDEIADSHDVSSGTIALAWLLAQPKVVVIPKTTDLDHLRENRSALDVELDQPEMDRISTLEQGRRLVDPDFAPW